ncbi:MAG: radical SAM protein [Elusimicrobiota bacterium]|jgi:radical SAM superfamily enzyme YgiQ (UPF0313 family)
MRVALVSLPVRFSSLLPIDLGYLSAYLKSRGHDVFVKDFSAELPLENDSHTAHWEDEARQEELLRGRTALLAQWVREIASFSPDFVGFSVWGGQVRFSVRAAEEIKKLSPKTKIIFGGPRFFGKDALLKGEVVDYAVVGEGEITLAEIVESGGHDRPIPGCVRRAGGEMIDGGRRPEDSPLCAFPFPDYSPFDRGRYLLRKTTPILFGRGCRWNCSFCTHGEVWTRFRPRSAQDAFAEIELRCAGKSGLQEFYVCDHSMNGDMGFLEELCGIILDKSRVPLDFTGFGQVHARMLDEGVLDRLKRAGFNHWGIGVQSGSDAVIKSMRRPYTSEQAVRALELMRKHGMDVCIDFIVGYPTETEEDFQKTLAFAERVRPLVSNISVAPFCCIGGNDLHKHPERYDILTHDPQGNAWSSKHNTPEIRAERYARLMSFLEQHNVPKRFSDSDRAFLEDKVGGSGGG